MVAVGTRISPRPPHRSQRALLTHRAPPSGSGVEAMTRQRVYSSVWRKEAGDELDEPLPAEACRLAARLVPDAHGAQSACNDAAIDPVAIADEVVRSLIPRKRLRYLTSDPFCRRVSCDVDPDEVSAVEPNDDEGVEQVETESWNNEHIHGGNVWRVVMQEGPPSLAGGDRRLTMYLATLD
jgi:hypothetical protein